MNVIYNMYIFKKSNNKQNRKSVIKFKGESHHRNRSKRRQNTTITSMFTAKQQTTRRPSKQNQNQQPKLTVKTHQLTEQNTAKAADDESKMAQAKRNIYEKAMKKGNGKNRTCRFRQFNAN